MVFLPYLQWTLPQFRIDKRQRELEAENRALRKQLAEKDEVIDVLKKSVGIFSKL